LADKLFNEGGIKATKMNFFIFNAVIFSVSLFIIAMLLYAYKIFRYPEYGKTRKRLKTISSGEPVDQPLDIIRQQVLSDVPSFNKILAHFQLAHRLDRLLQQANVHSTLGVFVLLSVISSLIASLGAYLTSKSYGISVIAAVLAGGIPFYYLLWKRKTRFEKFQRQFPDGLDFIARAMKAGYAITNGVKAAADEFEDPIGTEFNKIIDEVNFGVSFSDAMKNLAHRMDSPEVKFFVVSLIIQREAGGNLTEIIEKLADIIRERFKLEGRIRVLASEGKFSALILISLPFLVFAAIAVMNPEYLKTLIVEPIGRIMIYTAAGLMALGIMVMKKMINIKV
jgi:tight adherence protein B